MLIDKKTLIIEDILILSILYENYHNEKVFKTIGEIRDSKKIVDLVRKYRPDVLIMDIMLQGSIDGIQVAKRIRTFSDIPIIFISRNYSLKYYQKVEAICNASLMDKPISETNISQAVDNILRNVA
jgi:DNA-binding NarL/FixJ family response regulator